MSIRSGFMAGFAGLLMLLSLCAFRGGTPYGHPIKIAVRRNWADCGDGPRSTLIHVAHDGQVSVNGEVLHREQLKPHLHEIFGKRAERLAFLTGDGEAKFGHIVEVIDLARDQVDELALLTPAVQKATGCLTIDILPPIGYSRPSPPSIVKEVPVWRIWR